MAEEQQLGRLAFREEGDKWVAYFARSDSMEGAVFLAAIKSALVADNSERKHEFMMLMRACFGDMCEQVFGVRPVWRDPVKAPEHERSGNS